MTDIREYNFDTKQILSTLREWVEVESPTFDKDAVNRMMDLFKSISQEEALDFDIKYGKATNTEYFSGKALFKVSDTYFFTIIPLY